MTGSLFELPCYGVSQQEVARKNLGATSFFHRPKLPIFYNLLIFSGFTFCHNTLFSIGNRYNFENNVVTLHPQKNNNYV